MRLRKPGSEPPERARESRASSRRPGLARAATGRASSGSSLAIAREMLRIPAGLYMRAAESGRARATLAAWRFVWPLLQALLAAGGRASSRVAEREVTPAARRARRCRGAAVALAASQFADYRSVSIGTEQTTSGVEHGGPRPRGRRPRSAGSAHAWLGLPLGLAALASWSACAPRGNRRRRGCWRRSACSRSREPDRRRPEGPRRGRRRRRLRGRRGHASSAASGRSSPAASCWSPWRR